MLSISQKESILRKAGQWVPPFPVRRLPVQERYRERNARVPQEELEADRDHAAAVRGWQQDVERFYGMYMERRDAQATSRPAPLDTPDRFEQQDQ